ncbi:MAG: TatD family hydrolase [Proteobacteria bacterium]|nr:TatD family hydrolase [Pseudomonadota bacterium]MDA1355743.1 TatD family hydrolase [Pseudomonadota bacterium]
MLVDSHCHLDFEDFDGDRDAVLARAAEAGIGALQTICTRLSQFSQVLAIAEAYPNIWCSVGIHPHHVSEEDDFTTADLLHIVESHEKVIGIGETGLDFFYDTSPREEQIAAFRKHIDASRECGLPLIVHTRSADSETCEILREEAGKGAFPGVIHCFSVGREVAETALDLGFYISLSGIVTFKNAESLRDIARDIPLERLLVETDSPYLAPVPHRGRRNEPAFVRDTAQFIANLKGVDFAEIVDQSSKNFFELFTRVDSKLFDNK